MSIDARRFWWVGLILLVANRAGGMGEGLECEPGDVIEGEPVCHDDYDDQYNSGCGGTPPAYQAIACGETICGTSGTFLFEGLQYRDTDWFELTHAGGDLTFTATAELPVMIILIDAGAGDCWEYDMLAWTEAAPGEVASISVPDNPPGLYWLWIGPSEFSGWACGSRYRATLLCPSACPADLDGSGAVDFSDLLSLLGTWGPCPGCPDDLDGDGSIGLTDLLVLLGAWGSCP